MRNIKAHWMVDEDEPELRVPLCSELSGPQRTGPARSVSCAGRLFSGAGSTRVRRSFVLLGGDFLWSISQLQRSGSAACGQRLGDKGATEFSEKASGSLFSEDLKPV